MRQNSNAKAERRGFSPARRNGPPRSGAARTVGEFVPALMRPAFEKFGFPAAAILTEWPAIAGPELAAFTAPERLKWPRKTADDWVGEDHKGATLILRVNGPRALELEHCRETLIERINAAFGYRAVTAIRILQAPLPRPKASKPAALPDAPPILNEAFADLPEDRLKQALARMASGLESRRVAAEMA